jgi:hypothetical protein
MAPPAPTWSWTVSHAASASASVSATTVQGSASLWDFPRRSNHYFRWGTRLSAAIG